MENGFHDVLSSSRGDAVQLLMGQGTRIAGEPQLGPALFIPQVHVNRDPVAPFVAERLILERTRKDSSRRVFAPLRMNGLVGRFRHFDPWTPAESVAFSKNL